MNINVKDRIRAAVQEMQSDLEDSISEITNAEVAELLSVLREIDEEILGDCSGQPLQRWERLDGLRALKAKADA